MSADHAHVIGDFQFELRFDNSDNAFSQQSDISDYIKSELLPIADQVFCELADKNQTVQIDELELDLGAIQYASMRADIPRQFETSLREALKSDLSVSSDIASAGSAIHIKPDSPVKVHRLSSAESDLEIVWHYLSYGWLPWQIRSEDVRRFDVLFNRVLDTRCVDLLDRLRKSGSTIALSRLIAQLPENGLVTILCVLVSTRQSNITKLVKLIETNNSSVSMDRNCLHRIWVGIVKILIHGSKQAVTLEKLVGSAKTVLAVEGVTVKQSAEPENLLSNLLADRNNDFSSEADSLGRTIIDGQIDQIQKQWAHWMGPRRSVFHVALQRTLMKSRGRRKLMSALNTQQITDVVTILAPHDSDWALDLIRYPQIFAPGYSESTMLSSDEALEIVGYSLAFLASLRSGRVNKVQYLEYLLRQLAAHNNLSFIALLDSVINNITHLKLPGTLRESLFELTSELRQRYRNRQSTSVSSDNDKLHVASEVAADVLSDELQEGLQRTRLDAQYLVKLIASGGYRELLCVWPILMGEGQEQFSIALRGALQRRRTRTLVLSSFSEKHIIEMVRVLSPQLTGFITQVVRYTLSLNDDSKGSKRVPERTSMLLWDYTLAYLVVDRGSQFNKGSFLESLLHQLAAHENQDYAQMIKLFALQLPAAALLPKLCQELGALLDNLIQKNSQHTPVSQSDSSRLSGFEIIDYLRDSIYGFSRTHKRRELRHLVERLAIEQPQYLRHLYRELRNGHDPGQRQVSIDEVLDQIESRSYRRIKSVTSYEDNNRLNVKNKSDDTSNTAELLQLMLHVRQWLLRWPEYTRVLLTRKIAERAEITDTWERVLGAVDRFLSSLAREDTGSKFNPTSLVKELSDLSQRPMAFWQNILAEFSSQYTESNDLSVETLAVLDSILVTSSLQEDVMIDTYANTNVLQTFKKAVRTGRAKELRECVEALGSPIDLVDKASESDLAKAMQIMMPRDYLAIRYLVEVLTAAALFQSSYITARSLRRLIWNEAYDWLICRGQPATTSALARQLTERVLNVVRRDDCDELLSRLRARLPLNSNEKNWLENLSSPDYQSVIAAISSSSGRDSESRIDDGNNDQTDDMHQERIFIANAGMVLLAPYFPQLFQQLNLIEEGRFVGAEAAERAVHLLQYCVTGSVDTPEYQLVLNKLLCGLAIGHPIVREFTVQATEREAIESLLNAVIGHWKSLGNTSIEGLRETFLTREGRLELHENGWHLLVETKTYDILLDSLPWTYSLINMPWMDKVINVEWR